MATRTNVNSNPTFDGAGNALNASAATGDTIIVNRTSDNYTAGLSIPAVNLEALYFTRDYAGNIQDSPLEVDCSNSAGSKIVAEWAGQRLRLKGGSLAAHTLLEIRAAAGGLVTQESVTAASVLLISGAYRAYDTCDVNLVRAMSGQVMLDTSAQVTTNMHAHGNAVVTSNRPMTNVYVYGQAKVTNDHTGTGPTIVTIAGGRYTHRAGDIGTLTLLPGAVADFSKLRSSITITAAEVHEGAVWVKPPSGITVTITTKTTVGRGPLEVDNG